MRVVVTGGAGYLGSHLVRVLLARGDEVVVVDDFSACPEVRRPLGDVELHELDLMAGGPALEAAFRGADAVVHFAALKSVEESVTHPTRYYRENIGTLANALGAAQSAGETVFLFSSSAAVYGETDRGIIRETDPTAPINPYGATKLAGEQLTASAASAFGLRAASLRYFNAAGTGWPELADTGHANLVPSVIERVQRAESPVIFGDDYPTADGTGVRDYIHALDLAEAHVAVMDYLRHTRAGHRVFNVGTGHGASVAEVIDLVQEAAGTQVPPKVAPRRAGDPAEVVADVSRITREVGWRSRFSMADIVQSAWKAKEKA
jgi:UDP-glucose 4-epimerase